MDFQCIAATIVGLTASATAACVNITTSSLMLPTLLLSRREESPSVTGKNDLAVQSPKHIAQQWMKMDALGHMVVPKAVLLGTTSLIYAARNSPPSAPLSRNLLWASACFTLLVVPYTVMFTQETVMAMRKQASTEPKSDSDAADSNDTEFTRLLQEAAKEAFIRGLLPGVGVILAAIALVL